MKSHKLAYLFKKYQYNPQLKLNAGLSQLVEQRIYNEKVISSKPI